MKHAPSRAEQEYFANPSAVPDSGVDELALIIAEIENSPRAVAAELLKLRALRLTCQAKQRRLPYAVKQALSAARPPSIRDFLENQPEL